MGEIQKKKKRKKKKNKKEKEKKKRNNRKMTLCASCETSYARLLFMKPFIILT